MIVRLLILVITSLFTASCVNTNMYKPTVNAFNNRVLQLSAKSDKTEFEEAELFARAVQFELQQFIHQRHVERSEFFNSQILLAAGLIADAAIDYSKDLTIIGSIIGASSYTAMEQQDDPNRPKLFNAANKAIECALDVTRPLSIAGKAIIEPLGDITSSQYGGGLVQHIKILKDSRESLMASKAKLGKYFLFTSNEEKKVFLKESMALAETAYEQSASVLDDAIALQSLYQLSSEALIGQVITVVRSLSEHLNKTENDLNSVNTQLQGLLVRTSGFAGLPTDHLFSLETLNNAVGASLGGSGLRNDGNNNTAISSDYFKEYDKMADALAKTKSSSEVLSKAVTAIARLQSKEKLENCNLEVGDILMPISITPSQPLEFYQSDGGTDGFTISGGNAKYKASLIGGNVEGISVIQNGFSKYVTVVVEKNKVPVRNYRIEVVDTTGASATAVIAIKQKPSSNDGDKSSETKCDDTNKVCMIQQSLIMFGYLPNKANDGDCGDNTKKALTAMKKENASIESLESVKCNGKDASSINQFAGTIAEFRPLLKISDPKKLQAGIIDKEEVIHNQLILLTYNFESLFAKSKIVTNGNLKIDGQLTLDEIKVLNASKLIVKLIGEEISEAHFDDVDKVKLLTQKLQQGISSVKEQGE